MLISNGSSRSIVCALSTIQYFNLHAVTIPAANMGTQLFSSTILGSFFFFFHYFLILYPFMHTDSADNEKKNLEDSPKVGNIMGKHLRPAVIYLFLIILGLSLLSNLHVFTFSLEWLWEPLGTCSIFYYIPLSRIFIIFWRSLHCCLILHYWHYSPKHYGLQAC